MSDTNTHTYMTKTPKTKIKSVSGLKKKWWCELGGDAVCLATDISSDHSGDGTATTSVTQSLTKLCCLNENSGSSSQNQVSSLRVLDGNNDCWMLLQLCASKNSKKHWSLRACWTHHEHWTGPLTPRAPCHPNSLSHIFHQAHHNHTIATWYTIGTKDSREKIRPLWSTPCDVPKQGTEWYPFFSSQTRVRYDLLNAVSASHRTSLSG